MSRSEFELTNFGRFRMAIIPIKAFKCDVCDHVWLSRDRIQITHLLHVPDVKVISGTEML
ncbi:MAG: hypothetical protein WAL28_08155 [Nitrososphaeraceae archaeon]